MNKTIFTDSERNRIVFHFNKASLLDSTIPMWTIKHKGQTYYVNHLTSTVGFDTKETPESEHTKGSLQFRGALTIEESTEESTKGHKTAIIT